MAAVRGLWRLVVAAALALPTAAWGQDVPADLQITLERTTCFGTCPAYAVHVDAEGNVTYTGHDYVRVKGVQHSRIDPANVVSLVRAIDDAEFFTLQTQYRTIHNADGTEESVTDLPTTFVTVTLGGQTRRVEDYLGAPKPLRELEQAIDEAANTRQWVRIDPATALRLHQSAKPLSDDEVEERFLDALGHDDVDVVRTLLETGADPNRPYGEMHTPPLMMARSAAATRALLEAGAVPSAANDHGFTPLLSAADKAPEVTGVLLQAGAPVDQAPEPDNGTPLFQASCVGNAGAVKLLLAAGANPAADADGVSARECARQARQIASYLRPSPFDEYRAFVPDFDAVIALLASAVAPSPDGPR
jgi:hypothetical protein